MGANKVVLTGSGWSIPFGGYTVDDITDRVRGELWNDTTFASDFTPTAWLRPTYESVLAKYQQRKAMVPERKALEAGIASVLRCMDEDMMRFRSIDYYRTTLPGYISLFEKLGEGAVVFTLNHDLWFERFIYDLNWRLNIVGLKGNDQPQRRTALESDSSWPAEQVTPDISCCEIKADCLNIVKLHGGLNWEDTQGSLVVMGADKEAEIHRRPVLREFHKILGRRLGAAHEVLVYGYGFQDNHINTALREACTRRKDPASLFIFDCMPYHEWHEKRRQDAKVVKVLPRLRHYSSLGERVFGVPYMTRLDKRIEDFFG